jgi:hypothetical protein
MEAISAKKSPLTTEVLPRDMDLPAAHGHIIGFTCIKVIHQEPFTCVKGGSPAAQSGTPLKNKRGDCVIVRQEFCMKTLDALSVSFS